MNFFSHKIVNPTGDSPNFDDFVNNFLTQKEASEAKPECDDDPRGQCRGQVVNNDNEEGADSYQKGESVDGKPDQEEGCKKADTESEVKEADTTEPEVKEAEGKGMGECGKAGDVTEEHSDAGNEDEGNAKVEQMMEKTKKNQPVSQGLKRSLL
jgi:hypothetical protein